jgi:pilus assembly protein CpaB
MKASRLLVLAIAIVAGAVAAFLASRSHRPETQQAQAPALATVDVLIAKSDLSRGEVIGPRDIGWQIWPEVAANKNFIRRSAQPGAVSHFVGAIARVTIAAGQPIYDPMVVFAKSSGFMAAILPKGMRAVAMEISADSSAGGFILPEDHVDILLTRHDKAAEKVTGSEKIVSDTILRNVRVLAVDQAVEEKAGQKVVVGRTATVELTPKQAETLAMARQQGSLSLALRSLIDSQSSKPEGDGKDSDHSASMQTVRFGVSTMTAADR